MVHAGSMATTFELLGCRFKEFTDSYMYLSATQETCLLPLHKEPQIHPGYIVIIPGYSAMATEMPNSRFTYGRWGP